MSVFHQSFLDGYSFFVAFVQGCFQDPVQPLFQSANCFELPPAQVFVQCFLQYHCLEQEQFDLGCLSALILSLYKVEFPQQVCATELMEVVPVVEVGSPCIVAKNSVTETVGKMALYCFQPPGCGHCQHRETIGLVCMSKPIFASIHLCPCLIPADYSTVAHGFLNFPINGQYLSGKPADDIVNAAFTQTDPEAVFGKFLHPLIGKILSGMKVAYHTLQTTAVLDRGIVPRRKISFGPFLTGADLGIASVFCTYRPDNVNVYHLPF